MTTQATGLTNLAYFTHGAHPYDLVEWEVRDAVIVGKDGQPVFEARGVKFPKFWSQRATDIVASKYFRVVEGKRETSVKQMIDRVAGKIAQWGELDGYFAQLDRPNFCRELTHILLHQYASFNSPVWFNVGVVDKPQTSACFILNVEDSMESILEWYRQEALIFKSGSGAGVNVSKLRGRDVALSNGGKASGPVSFMRGADTNAGTIKSGGGTRRAAKMVILDVDHSDIEEFIWCKVKAEKMARILAQAGYTDGLEDEVRDFVPFQNANNSVSVTDEFMACATSHRDDGNSYGGPTHLLQSIAKAAWECGDPGLFFKDTINRWHTTPERGEIVSSNPCGEFLRPPNEACNLASLNLLKFLKDDGSFDIPTFEHTVDIMITAMDILIDRSSYPTEKIAENSRNFRPLGLGYANLGALLMAKGLAYDSDEGRSYAASVTALMTGEAYRQSAKLAEVKGAFTGFSADEEIMLDVIRQHQKTFDALESPIAMHSIIEPLWQAAYAAWSMPFEYGFRNCQVSVLAPTGTISFMMDCDTTGIEPALGLVTHKKLVGGGEITMVNGVVHRAMQTLGYEPAETEKLCASIYDGKPFAGRTEHDAVFATALGSNAISWQGHIKMVAAVQPFISGGCSKTINMPNSSTVQDVYDAYVMSWQLGLKAVAVYRDGCKNVQPVTVLQQDINSTMLDESSYVEEVKRRAKHDCCIYCGFDLSTLNTVDVHTHKDNCKNAQTKMQRQTTEVPPVVVATKRTRLPDERQSVVHKFTINGHEGYVTVGLYENGQPGEVFLKMAKEGSVVSGLMDTVGILTSLLLQHGVPLGLLTNKLKGMSFEPAGITANQQILFAKSVIDYVFRWLEVKYAPGAPTPPYLTSETVWALDPAKLDAQAVGMDRSGRLVATEAPTCPECGQLMLRRTGSCFVCDSCGTGSGCS